MTTDKICPVIFASIFNFCQGEKSNTLIWKENLVIEMYIFFTSFKNYGDTLSGYDLSNHQTKPEYREKSGMLL